MTNGCGNGMIPPRLPPEGAGTTCTAHRTNAGRACADTEKPCSLALSSLIRKLDHLPLAKRLSILIRLVSGLRSGDEYGFIM